MYPDRSRNCEGVIVFDVIAKYPPIARILTLEGYQVPELYDNGFVYVLVNYIVTLEEPRLESVSVIAGEARVIATGLVS